MNRSFAHVALKLLALIVLAVLLIAAATAVSRWWHSRGPVQKAAATAEQLERGRTLVLAADCAACHTADNGAPFAGGVPLASAFGTLHGTNITPDPEHGIGRYTADDFFDALTKGKARDGHPLYPAMPYVSYRRMAREDSDAMYAYLMNRPAVNVANARNDVNFPANIRTFLHGWKLLFARRDIPASSQGDSAQWQRGRYLVDTLGHCGECHTPRGVLGQLKVDRTLHGNADFGRFAVPDITPAGLAARGWDAATLHQYLSTGVSPRAVASDEMLKVVNLSTSRLAPADVEAIVTYLLGDRAPAPTPFAVAAATDDAPARRTYFDLCAGCHGRDGEGVPNVAPDLRANSSVREANPHNLIVAMLDGLPVHDLPGIARMQDMPAFGEELDDAQIASLATWMRQRYGGQDAVVDASAVRELREADSH
ncbi:MULTISPECIES: cytochrome c [unclassified Lysobacter]|uniref:cytochrome c n=1 Tax=unclassified Lysobacter TaxID=2635362 RepID=UPI001C234E71|nr:cytochrome c [Lysobacter sp. MMG2]MBU8976621.1 cytochrome c [Lysobacter sp. MMG2]